MNEISDQNVCIYNSLDEKCLILTHEGFPDIPWTKKTLDILPTNCNSKKEFKYICELNLYLGGNHLLLLSFNT